MFCNQKYKSKFQVFFKISFQKEIIVPFHSVKIKLPHENSVQLLRCFLYSITSPLKEISSELQFG